MTAQAPRFKIDRTKLTFYRFGLYFSRRGWFNDWRLIGVFETLDEAKAHYEEIKDRYEEIKNLPEYLP